MEKPERKIGFDDLSYINNKDGIDPICQNYADGYNDACNDWEKYIQEICKKYDHIWSYGSNRGPFVDGIRTCAICGKQEEHSAIKFG